MENKSMPSPSFYEEEYFTDQQYSFGQDASDSSSYDIALQQLRDILSQKFSWSELSSGGPQVTAAAEKEAHDFYLSFSDYAVKNGLMPLDIMRDEFVRKVLADLLRMGPLEALLGDDTIEDIAVNGPEEVMIYRKTGWEHAPIAAFPSAERTLDLFNRAITHSNRQANQVRPIVDATLPDGERVSIVTHPITSVWPVAVIRAHRAKGITLADMIRPHDNTQDDEFKRRRFETERWGAVSDYFAMESGGMLTPAAASYLHAAVLAGLNIMVVGPTGSGKTTLLTALGRCLPADRRTLIIEDTPEINILPDSPTPRNIIYLRTRPADMEGIPPVMQKDLVKLALRQRPNALTLGEARGAEVFELLNALNTGHRNGLTSIHAFSPEDVFMRIFMMLGQSEEGRYLSQYLSASLVAKTIHIIVSLEKVGEHRRVLSIMEMSGEISSSNIPSVHSMFRHTGGPTGRLDGVLNMSAHAQAFRYIECPEWVFSAVER